jgi:hypothetical protein
MSFQNKKIYFIVGHGRLSTCEDDVSSFEEFKDEYEGITTCVTTSVPNNNNLLLLAERGKVLSGIDFDSSIMKMTSNLFDVIQEDSYLNVEEIKTPLKDLVKRYKNSSPRSGTETKIALRNVNEFAETIVFCDGSDTINEGIFEYLSTNPENPETGRFRDVTQTKFRIPLKSSRVERAGEPNFESKYQEIKVSDILKRESDAIFVLITCRSTKYSSHLDTSPGGRLLHKYLKYKQKYLQLKNKLFIK